MKNSQQSLNLDAFLASPDFYPINLDILNNKVLLVQLTRKELRDASFHNKRSMTGNRKTFQVDLSSFLSWTEEVSPEPKPVGYIFHNAFCGSTLLSRYLDIAESTIVYREPSVLATLCDCKQNSPQWLESEPLQRMFRLMVASLTRRKEKNERSVIKLNDRCNNSIDDLLDLHPVNRGVLLFSDFQSFLLAILDKPVRRKWLNERSNFCTDTPLNDYLPTVGASETSFTDAIARYWLTQMLYFARVCNRQKGKVLPLPYRELVKRPEETVTSVVDFLNIGVSSKTICENVTQIKQVHAKTGKRYYAKDDLEQKTLLSKKYAQEIEQATRCKDVLLESNSDLKERIVLFLKE